MASAKPCPCHWWALWSFIKEFGRTVYWRYLPSSTTKTEARFTVGIYDDVTNLSLPLPENTLPNSAKLEALFYGLVVMAAFPRPKQYQDYRKFHAVVRTGLFCFTTPKKAGGLTVSHLRVSEQPIRSAYLISRG